MKPAHWAALAVCALAEAFAAGRYSRPARVEIIDNSKIVEVVKTVEVVKVVTVKAEATRTRRTEVITPDGTVTRTEDARTETSTETRADTSRDTASARTAETEHHSLTEDRPTWHVSALVGVTVPGLAPVYGAHVQRSVPILGIPFTAGLWGVSSGVGGVSLGLEW